VRFIIARSAVQARLTLHKKGILSMPFFIFGKKVMKSKITFLILIVQITLYGQVPVHSRIIKFPDPKGLVLVVSDLHQHTVFSDGSVWPDIRVEEAIRDGIQLISLTEHLEYLPHLDDIPHPDRNRSFEIAKKISKPFDIMVAHGAEITRSMPPGHNNAIFISDANQLLIEDSIEVFREANNQGAFVFWNHPNWTAQIKDGITKITPTHEFLIKNKLLHGIEIVNELTYSEEAFQLALDYDLTIMANSDIHGLVDWLFEIEDGGHRPATLILAKEKSEESIKEALFNQKTIAYFNHQLIGRSAEINALLESTLIIESASYIGPSTVAQFTIKNLSNTPFILVNKSPLTLHQHADLIQIKPLSETKIQVKTKETLSEIALEFEVLNALTAPKKNAVISYHVAVKD
jgi:3',5'-nucleoside bisphosphate phosphatase